MWSNTDMSLFERLRWKISGDVSEIIVEDFDEASDAVLLPFFQILISAAFALFAISIYDSGATLPELVVIICLSGVALMVAVEAAMGSIAAVVYYKETASRLTVWQGNGGVDR